VLLGALQMRAKGWDAHQCAPESTIAWVPHDAARGGPRKPPAWRGSQPINALKKFTNKLKAEEVCRTVFLFVYSHALLRINPVLLLVYTRNSTCIQ
jgi:hypothetical protein